MSICAAEVPNNKILMAMEMAAMYSYVMSFLQYIFDFFHNEVEYSVDLNLGNYEFSQWILKEARQYLCDKNHLCERILEFFDLEFSSLTPQQQDLLFDFPKSNFEQNFNEVLQILESKEQKKFLYRLNVETVIYSLPKKQDFLDLNLLEPMLQKNMEHDEFHRVILITNLNVLHEFQVLDHRLDFWINVKQRLRTKCLLELCRVLQNLSKLTPDFILNCQSEEIFVQLSLLSLSFAKESRIDILNLIKSKNLEDFQKKMRTKSFENSHAILILNLVSYIWNYAKEKLQIPNLKQQQVSFSEIQKRDLLFP